MSTEDTNPLSSGIDALPVAEVLHIMHKEDRAAVEAVEKELRNIERTVEDAV
jgi:N-acetylmuramic acid 6-phosphate (MurNAc-6-P) etherase